MRILSKEATDQSLFSHSFLRSRLAPSGDPGSLSGLTPKSGFWQCAQWPRCTRRRSRTSDDYKQGGLLSVHIGRVLAASGPLAPSLWLPPSGKSFTLSPGAPESGRLIWLQLFWLGILREAPSLNHGSDRRVPSLGAVLNKGVGWQVVRGAS